MKKIITITALLLLFKPIFPIIAYAINYKYIIRTHCINANKPELKCYGKCYLKNQLANNIETEKPIAANKKTPITEFEVLFFQEIKKNLHIIFYSLVSKPKHIPYLNLYSYAIRVPIFRPPICSLSICVLYLF